eukprot:CAMPEP_0185907838 /NCGR_PEP_ID=MMETSP0196C-20130402/7756_1 /TAXON_ID=2932 /ORGANISM="Alexandrium fundyense, Strain CCMP1719" /LENGTH=87 /DNA_ID=CAMNT_0028627917 /DNA_START=16 /DNA_END=275 /DNA_ORIENTATION=+
MPFGCPKRAGPSDVVVKNNCRCCRPWDQPMPEELKAQGVTEEEFQAVICAGNKTEGTMGMLLGIAFGIVGGVIGGISGATKTPSLWG